MNVSLNKKCSFFGHRNASLSDEQRIKLKDIIENLIVNKNVDTFLFGSKSEFDQICHTIVTELKTKYSLIKRIKYTCQSESCIFENEKEYWEKVYSRVCKKEVKVLAFEEEQEHKTKYTAGKISYVERNQAMIDDSDFCIFYYNKNYQPEMKKYSKRCVGYYQPKSGTALAYKYAKQKKKNLINIYT